MGRIVVNQITVNNGFTVGIIENRFSENLGGVQCGSCSQRNFHSVKILNDGAVFADIVILVTVEHFGFAHFLVQNVSTVCLIDHNQIVVSNGGHGITLGIEDTFDKALYRSDMYFRFSVNFLFIQALDIVDGIQGHQFFDFDFFENILGLLTKGSTVHQEQHALEAVALDEAINHTQNGAGLAGASGHGKQNGLLAVDDCLLCCFDGADLIFTQIQSVRVAQQIKRSILECGIGSGNVLFELFHQALGTNPALQCFGSIGTAAQIQIPDTGLGLNLFQILPAIGSKNKWNFISAPLVDDVLLVFGLDSLGVLLALMVDNRGNVNSGFLGFHNTHELQPNKQGIICIAVFTHSRISRPLSDSNISAFLRTGSLGIAQIVGIGLPTEFAELLVNQIAGFSLGKFHALGRSFALFCTLLGGFGRCRSRYCFDLLGERSNLFFLFFDDCLIVWLGYIFRHDKSRGNISPVAIYLHEPNRKVIGHGEQSFCVLHRVSTRMDRIVSRLAKRIGYRRFSLESDLPASADESGWNGYCQWPAPRYAQKQKSQESDAHRTYPAYTDRRWHRNRHSSPLPHRSEPMQASIY